MRWTVLAAAAAALMLTACARHDGAALPAAAEPLTTQSFGQRALSSGRFEIQSSLLPAAMTQNDAIRTFAQRMVEAHAQANQELMAILLTNDIPVLNSMTRVHAAMFDTLANAATRFEPHYAAMQVEAHEEAASLFAAYAENGDNADLRAFAVRMLPVLQEHLDAARTLARQVAEEAS